MITSYEAKKAFENGHITLGELHEHFDLELLYSLASSAVAKRRRQQFEWERKNRVPVPKSLNDQDVFEALVAAIEESDRSWMDFTSDPQKNFTGADHSDLLGHVTYDEVACAIAGISIRKTHHVSGARRVIPHLRNLVEAGVVAPYLDEGSQNQRGWSITELGERVISGDIDLGI